MTDALTAMNEFSLGNRDDFSADYEEAGETEEGYDLDSYIDWMYGDGGVSYE